MNWTKSIAILALVLMPTIGQASHTRGSTLYWEKHPSISNAIILYGTASTARSTRWATGSYTGLGTLNFTTSVTIEYFNGSGTTNTSQVGTQFAPSSLVFLSNTIEDYTTRKLVHYDANGNLVDGAIVKFTSGTTWPQEVDFVYACCRVSNISASGTESNLGTEINLSGGNSSPVAATPAVIQVPSSLIGSTWTYQLTASDPDNDGVKFRLGTPSEFGGTWVRTDYAAPVGLSISGSGLITWQIPSGTSSSALAALGYIIEDYTPSDPNQTVKSSASYDIILRLVNTTTNQPPVIVSAPSTTQYYPYLVGAGSSYNFQIDVEDVYNSSTNTLPGSGNHVTINEISGIPNLTYTVTTQSNEKSVINATFTPTVAQTGKSYTAVFEINDGNLTTYQNVSIQVRNNPNPSIADIDFTGDGCSSLIFASTDFSSVFSDPDSDPMELIRIDALPSSGSLTFKGVSVQVNDEIIASEISYLQYFNSTPGVYSFDWSAKDNQGYWSQTTETATINIEGISTTVAPLTASGTDVTPAVIDNAATVISSSTFTTASIEITNNLTTGDVLASGSGTLPSGATDSYANGVLTLSGTAMTASELQTWFRGVTFQSSSSSQKRTFTFTAGATTTGCNSLSSDRILNNTLPVISSLSDQSTCLTGSTTSQSFTVSDVEDTDPNVLTVSVSTSNPSVVALSDISYSVSNGTGSIAVTNAQSFGSSVITVTVTDQGGATSSSSFVWRNTVVDGIDASSGSTFIPYASTATLIDNALLVTSTNTFTNPKVSVSANFQSGDALSLSSSYSLPSGSSSYNSTTGELTITGTYSASQLQAMFRAVQFSTSSSNENARTIQFDGGSSSGSSACYVGVTTKEVTLNQTPTISGPTAIATCIGGSAINETITVGDANDGTGGVSLSASASSNTAVLPTSAISFSGTGAARTMTITVPSGASAGTTNLTIEVSDRFGKTATVVVPFTLSTFGYTSITPPTDITQNIDLGECDAHVYLADPTVIGGTCYTWTNDEPAHFEIGTTTVTWQLLDQSGTVQATVTQDVTIVDNVNPTLTVVSTPISRQLTSTAGFTLTESDFVVSKSDNCGTPTVTYDRSLTFDCADEGQTITVTVTATDQSGNTATGTVDVEVLAADDVVTFSTSTGASSTNVTDVAIDPSITVAYPDDVTAFTAAYVTIDNNFSSGDILYMDPAYTMPTGITANFNSTTGTMTIAGSSISESDIQDIFQHVMIKSTSSNSNTQRSLSFTLGDVVAFAGTGHFYEYISGSYSWTAAKADAATRTLNGMQGYLATIMSEAENDFIEAKVSANAWIGASDEYSQINSVLGAGTFANQGASEGRYYWITGPEAGQLISVGNGTPVVQPGMYEKWSSGEPNNVAGGTEHYIHMWGSSNGEWNDYPNSQSIGYVIEYGGSTADANCFEYTSSINVEVLVKPIVTTNSSATSVADVSAVIGGEVVAQGGSAVSERGIVFSTSSNPTTADSKALATTSTGVGTFTSNLTGLAANTTYYARAYATNSQGTSYGAEITFTTTPTAPATITTDYDDATFGGSIICAGQTATLTTSSTTTGTITWYAGGCGTGTALGTGATLAVTPSATTTYYARVENASTGLNSTCESVTVTVQSAAPTISYGASYYLYYSDEAISANSLTVSASSPQGYVSSYSISPSLPAGLSFNTATGQITGTPTNGYALTTYTVTGNTPCGSISTTLDIEILQCSGLDVNDFTLRGSAATIGTGAATEFKLTDASNGQFGAVWNQTRLDLTKDFDIEAQVYLGNKNGADGIAFVLQPLSTNQGSTGGGLGYAGISPSFAVEFDTYDNGSADPTADHIAFMENGNTTNHYGAYLVEMEDGAWRSVRFKWEASSKTIRFYIDGVEQITRTNYDMVANLFSNNPYVYWGFTGATGGLNNLQKVKFDRYCLTLAANTVANLTTTSPVVSQTSTTASVEGTLVNDGGAPVTERGIVMGTASAPTTANLKVADASTGIGTYTNAFTGLTPSTLYYARSYAINSVGTGYGNEISFYTAPIDVAAITSTNYNSTVGYDVICYGTSTTLTATTPDGVVQWYDDAGLTNLIGTGNSITVSPTATTTYYARNLNNGLYSDNTASLTVTVRPQLVAAVISGAETVCWNSRPNALTGVAATGGSSAADAAPGFSYQWEESTDGGTTWTAISGATNYATYQPGYLYQTTRYRLVATDLGTPSCTSALISNEIEITVRDPFTPSVVSTNGTNNTFCDGGSINLSATPTTGGSGPAFYYQWQQSADSLNWTNIGPLLNNTTAYTATGITSDTHFRIIAFDQGTPACGSVFSTNTVKAVMQTPVTEGDISGAQHICAQTAPTAAIANVTAGTGRGTISYRWEESTDGGTTWTTIAGATSDSYQPGVLAVTTKYRRFTVSTLNGFDCESTSPTSEVEITVDQLPIATMTTTTDVTCVNAAYTLSGVNAQYGTVTWSHNGAGSLTGTSTLTPTYTPSTADAGNTVTITMTVTGTTICLSTTETASIDLQVDALPVAVAGGTATICSNATHTVSGASSANGTIAWTHDGNGVLTDVNSLTPTYAPTAADAGNAVTLTMTVSSDNQCAGETAVATYTVNVDPLPVAIAGGSDIICSEATAVVSGASAANGTILWTHNGSGTISDATTLTPSYTADAADAGSTVTLTMTVSSTNTCTPQTATATYAVTVRPDFVPATFVAQDQDLCYLTSADVITATAATGGTGPYSYQWQMSTDSATWTNVSGATSLTYQPVGILNATQYYRILSTDDGSPGCGTSMAGEDDVKILVRDPLTPPVVSNITVCNSTSTTITPIGARGGRGEFEYQWQESANGSTGWANVGVSSLDSTYTTPTLTTGTTYYRVIARDKDKGSLLSCGSTFSSAMKVTIGATATSGAIAGDETICTGDVAASITSTTDGTGSGTISYQWEESTDGGTTWTTIAGATSNTFSPGILTQTTSYRRTTVATLNGVPCESAVTTAVTKTVHQLPTFTAAPSNMTVNTDAGLPTAAVSYTATATGPTAVTLTYAITGATTASGSGTGSGEPFNIGTSTVVISATTNCGVTTTTFDVEVIDNENPTITAGADESHNTTVATTGCAMPLTVVSPVAADNAPGVAVSYVLTGATTGSGTSIANVSFNVGTTTITWTATDASGNTATDVQDIIVVDAVAPAIAGMPADMTLNADAGLCTTTATWTVPTSIDECGIASFTADAASGDVFTVGTTTVTYTAVDNNGNTTTASFDVTVVDNQLPVIAGTPADITLVSDANACGATATWTAPTSSDNCGIASFVSTHASGDFFAVGTTTVTYTATDVNGNIETGSFDVTVSDLDPVIAGVPANISVGNDAGNCSAVVTWTAPTVSDNCSGVTMVSTHNSGDTFPEGTTTVTYTATDNNGNTTTASFDITVSDTEDPIFVSAPADMTVSTSATTCDAIVTWTSPVVSDNCTSAPTVTSTHASGDTFAKGTTTVTYTVTDAEGNDETHSFDVTVEDNTAPIITAVTDITVDVDAASCESANPGVVTPSATDNCDATVTVTGVRSDALALNAPYPLGTTTITWSASDSEGNAATSLTQDVTVLDTIAPYVTQQLADTLYVDENSCVFYLEAWRDSIQFSDNCGGVATLTSARPANLFLNKGTHVINYTLTDVDGNTRVYNHAVEIMDTIPPVLLNMPADLTVNASATSCGAIVTWTPPTPSDNCVSFVMTGTAKSGDYFNVGTTTVVYSLVDAEGYTVKDSFDITVVDATAPVIASSNATVVLDASGAATIALSDVLASAITDNCGLASSSVDVTSFGCADLGTNTVTITATDIHGNTSTATATVTVVDQAAPTVVAQNITIYLDTTGAASITVADVHDSSSDNCGVSATTIDVSSFGCSDLGANTVVVTSTDASGNAGTATATVTVLDTISPSLSVPAAGYTAYASANSCGATVTFTGITGADNCSAPTITYDMVSGATYSVGTTTVTATATDGSGNTTTATFDVTVLDTISPSIVNVPSTVTIVPDVNSCNSTVSWSMPNTTDNCSATLTSSVASGSSFGLGTHQVVFTAVDPSGNNSYDTLTFTVTDMVDPTLDNVPADTILYSSANTCDVMYAWPSIIGSDNCSVVTVSTSVASGSMFSVGVTTVNVTGTDAAGNTVIGSFDVTVVDTISPIWVFVPANINSGNCNSAVTYTLPTASDNCSSVTVAQVAGLPSGSTFPSGTTTNTFVATDASGNTSTVSFDVVINTTSISYAPPVSSLCENDAAVDLTDTAYALTFSGNGVSGSMFDPSDAGVGVHTLQYTFVDSLGCTITGNFSIAVNQLPTIPTIVRLSSTMLTVNNIYPSYQWYRNGVKINGATSRTYTVTQAGEYSVKVGNGNCYVFSDAFGFGIGIDEVEKGSYIVYPNPSHGQFKIVHGFDTDNMTIQVVNMLGQVIYQSLENESNITIDLSDVAQGSYILIMRNQETEVRQPLKIQR